jgi:hypothetical protein
MDPISAPTGGSPRGPRGPAPEAPTTPTGEIKIFHNQNTAITTRTLKSQLKQLFFSPITRITTGATQNTEITTGFSICPLQRARQIHVCHPCPHLQHVRHPCAPSIHVRRPCAIHPCLPSMCHTFHLVNTLGPLRREKSMIFGVISDFECL